MTDAPHPQLLPREEVCAQVRQFFAGPLSLLEELVNYGSNLIARCHDERSTQLQDTVILHNFLRQAVAALDGVHVLAGAACTEDATILLRTVFETRLYLAWIFADKAKTAYRAKLYFVWEVRNARKWTLRAMAGTPENAALNQRLEHRDIDYKLPDLPVEALAHDLAVHDAKLAATECAAINQEFEALKGKTRNWYQPGGPDNLKELADEAQLTAEYTVFYEHFSKFSHGHAFGKNVKLGKSDQPGRAAITIGAMRTIQGLDEVFRYAFNFANNIFDMTLKHYRPGEVPQYYKKYVTEWRDRIWAIPAVRDNADGTLTITPPLPPPPLPSVR